MSIDWGNIPLGTVIPFPFAAFDGGTGASLTMSGIAVTDIECYKGTSMTQRSSDAGYALMDTDGIDLDGTTGIHGFSIDTGDNTDAGFFVAGSLYWVVVASVTIDGQTVNFVAGTFRLVAAESVAGVVEADVTHFGGTGLTATGGRPEVNTTHAAGTAWGSGAITAASIATGAIDADAIADNAIDAGAIAADAITAAKIADGAIDAATFAAGAITATVIATGAIDADAIADNAIDAGAIAADAITAAKIADGAIDAATFAAGAITAAAIAADAIGASELAADAVNEIVDQVWRETLTDHSGTAGSTAEALGAAGSAGDPWSTALPGAYSSGQAGKIIGDNINATISSRATQTSVDDLPTNAELATSQAGADDATLAAIAALSIPTAAQNADAVWDEATSGHTTSGTFGEQAKTDIDAILADTGTDGVVVASHTTAAKAEIEAEVDDALGGGTGTALTGIPWNAAWDAEVESEVNDALTTAVADSVPADGSRPSVAQAAYMLVQLLTEMAISGTTLTVKKPDGSTTLFSCTLNDATTPSSVTRSG